MSRKFKITVKLLNKKMLLDINDVFNTMRPPAMLPHAKEWATILNSRILNHEPSRRLYINVLNRIDITAKDTIVKLLNEIKTEKPARFENSANEVLSAIK